jgi:hypothetical protein
MPSPPATGLRSDLAQEVTEENGGEVDIFAKGDSALSASVPIKGAAFLLLPGQGKLCSKSFSHIGHPPSMLYRRWRNMSGLLTRGVVTVDPGTAQFCPRSALVLPMRIYRVAARRQPLH